ncbi:uncharacterized protein V1510DRAFT_416699 [Dipodascopsis tothii]|uniref:uncharacterized protein n=1 Tax=Dipodascopsis tothii TaxID=44089 RepID=UPI0034CEF5A9
MPSNRRRSAGTTSPTLILTTSPTTRSWDEILSSSPPRSTTATGADSDSSDFIVRSAFRSCTKPMAMLSAITAVMTPPSIQSLVPYDSDIASTRTSVSELDTWRSRMAHTDRPPSLSSTLRPSRASTRAAAASDRPQPRSDSSAAASAAGGTVCGGAEAARAAFSAGGPGACAPSGGGSSGSSGSWGRDVGPHIPGGSGGSLGSDEAAVLTMQV